MLQLLIGLLEAFNNNFQILYEKNKFSSCLTMSAAATAGHRRRVKWDGDADSSEVFS